MFSRKQKINIIIEPYKWTVKSLKIYEQTNTAFQNYYLSQS